MALDLFKGPKDRLGSRAIQVASREARNQCLALALLLNTLLRMFQSISLGVVSVVISFLASPILQASISVREIEFSKIDEFASEGEWLECSLLLDVRRDSVDRERRHPDYIDGIVVNLMLGIEVEPRSSSQTQFDFYTAEANLVSLPEGRHTVRFYLPPEIVERDRIRQQPHSYLIRLMRGDRIFSEAVSPELERPNVRQSFLSRIGSDAPKNKGILLAQPQTPFVLAYPDDTPSFKGVD